MRLPGFFAAAVLLAVPTAALAGPGLVTTPVSLKVGPGSGFPTVDRIPGGVHINIHGCIRGASWCDVSWSDDRGWVAAQYLEYYYRNRYVLLPDYVDVIDVPIVPFALDTYWASYYAGRPWYHRLAYWNNYWRSNARFATQLPTGRSARETRTGAAIARDSIGQRGAADVRGARADRFAHENRSTRGFAQGTRAQGIRETHQPMAGARHLEGNRFSAAPTPGRMAQPNVGRPGGASFAAHAQPSQPLAAHAQMGGPRPMGGGAGGGAPHVNAAPRAGGGPAPAGGPPGRHH